MADGGNVAFVEIDGPVVYLRLQGACGIKRRLMEKIPVRPRPHQSLGGCGR